MPSRPYNIRAHILQEVKEAKYLGVTITKDLWKNHIGEISAKAKNTLLSYGGISHVLHYQLKENYTTFFRPVMEYAFAVWDPNTKVTKQAG